MRRLLALPTRGVHRFDPRTNYYRVLGVEESTPPEGIDKRYKQLASRRQNERMFDTTLQEREEREKLFREQEFARDTLLDEQCRGQVDSHLRRSRGATIDWASLPRMLLILAFYEWLRSHYSEE